MLVREAKTVARAWVADHAASTPGFRGAFFHGSVNWLADDAVLPATSDLDIMLVLEQPAGAVKPGKLSHRGVMLEISHLSAAAIGTPATVLGNYRLAGSFRTDSAISDPFGDLERLTRVVSTQFAQRRWVEARCQDAERNVRRFIASFDRANPLHEQVSAWLFASGVLTHLLLVAGLENPTVRTRYRATRQLLATFGFTDFYEVLLDQLGCAAMTAADVSTHLDTLAEAFAAARRYVAPNFEFAADISAPGQIVAIDGSREMIVRGDHREAIFWIVATSARCQKVLVDGAPPEVAAQFQPAFHALLAALGVSSVADRMARNQGSLDLLPQVWPKAHAIMAAHPGIRPD